MLNTKLTIAALSTPKTISFAVVEGLKSAETIFAQTDKTPCTSLLTDMGLSFETMDELYEKAEDFDELLEAISLRLIEALGKGDVLYAVLGSGAYTDYIISRARQAGAEVELLPGMSFAAAASLSAGLCFPVSLITPANSLPSEPDTNITLLIEELDSRLMASQVKLKLLELYPYSHEVTLFNMLPTGEYEHVRLPLFELDTKDRFNAATVLVVEPCKDKESFSFIDSVELMELIRRKCPWDKKQTHDSLKTNLIEECYEVLDAIESEDDDGLCEELGDVLLQCVFHSIIAREDDRFTMRDVTTGLAKKLIHRHPHIFKDTKADTPEQVLKNWEDIKKIEKSQGTQSEVLKSVPNNLPALLRAYKVQKKAAHVGFDHKDADEAFTKLLEETAELKEAMKLNEGIADEMGDVLFSAVNVARLLGLNPEELLRQNINKFIERFVCMEKKAIEDKLELKEMDAEQLDKLWNRAKATEKYRK